MCAARSSSPVTADFRVLVVDDEQLYARAIGRELDRAGMSSDLAFTAAEALEKARTRSYALVLLDHKLPDDDGIGIVPLILARQHGATVIVMTAFEAIPNAIQAIRNGAEDYIVKQPSLEPLVAAIREVRQRRELDLSLPSIEDDIGRDGLLGVSAPILAVREQLRRVSAGKDTTVLLCGETGSGKEVAARSLHLGSAPAGSPFIAVDCVAMPSPLVESLLFGHEKGAFTGADRTQAGAFEEAGEGTIFLDEIGEMDMSLQGKLLRVLESRTFHRLGSVKEKPVMARVVAATHRDLMELVDEGRFRFDLYQRLSVFPIAVPSLRERGEDILVLARHFVKHFARKLGIPPQPLPREVESRLLGYDFPGNVRELRNIIERAMILCEDGRIETCHLPERLLREGIPTLGIARSGTTLPFDFVPGVDTLETLEKKLIRQALDRAAGNKSEAARLLGLSRFQLLRRLEKLRLAETGD
jgi:DNA-binding NtrC family response regulator